MKNLLLLIFCLFMFECFAQSTYPSIVVSFNQGLNNQGQAVQIQRSNPTKALGNPQNVDIETGAINFVALGFGGSIVVGFPSPIPVNPNTVLRPYETTYTYSCATYPETARIFVSKDGTDYFFLGESCGNDSPPLFLYGLVDSVKYIKVLDISELSDFSMFLGADAYDLDGLEIFNLNPLAIEMGEFRITWNGSKINVVFETLSEANTWKFDIQVSEDAVNFRDLISFGGAGWSTFARRYEGSVDFEPVRNITYFRLKETDYNGNILYYNLTQVVTQQTNFEILINYDLSGRIVNDQKGFFIVTTVKNP